MRAMNSSDSSVKWPALRMISLRSACDTRHDGGGLYTAKSRINTAGLARSSAYAHTASVA
jgi:hypothetical protein